MGEVACRNTNRLDGCDIHIERCICFCHSPPDGHCKGIMNKTKMHAPINYPAMFVRHGTLL
jgi:hypothetical protein